MSFSLSLTDEIEDGDLPSARPDDLLAHVLSDTTIHTAQQFELTFDYRLYDRNQPTRQRYTVDSYFFIPRSMGINASNYSREQFYGDLTHYLRLQTPEQLNLEQADTWSLPQANRYFEVHLIDRARRQLRGAVIQEVRLFGCSVDHQLRRVRLNLRRLLDGSPQNLARRLRHPERHLQHVLSIFAAFRSQYIGKLKYQTYLVDDEVKRTFLLVDEYLSYRLEAVLSQLHELLRPIDLPEVVSFQELIHWTLVSEMEYRNSEKLLNLNKDSPESLQETYYYRLGLLKKHVSEVLYLQINNLRQDRLYRNLIAAAGAALAAFWAGLIDLQRFYWVQQANGQSSESGHTDFALRFFLFVILGVIAYIFKDRIKELTREYFFERLKQYLPDYEYDISYDHYPPETGQAQAIKVGSSRQFMRFLKKTAVPPEIAYIREWGHPNKLEPERLETIMHFSKTLVFENAQLREQLPSLRVVRDLLRFNISAFLSRMDQPSKKLRYFDATKGFSQMKAPKVYHLNLVLQYTLQDFRQEQWMDRQYEFEHLRLVLNKKGIVRIEQLLPRGELAYREHSA